MAAAGDSDEVVLISSSTPSRSRAAKPKGAKKTVNPKDNMSADAKKRKKSDNQPPQQQKNKKPKANSSSLSSSPPPAVDAKPSASCRFPMSRVWRMVKGEGGGADVRPSNEAVFLINKATEMFLQRFAEDGYASAAREHKKSISYNYLSSIVNDGKRYEFLADFVPEKVKAKDALKALVSAEL